MQRTFRCVLLALVVSAGGRLLGADAHLPAFRIEAVYPGANAQTVLDTVAAPIEQQLNGLERVRHLISRCTNDGKYSALVSFEPGVDMGITLVLVQNRVALALPTVPAAVQNQGITVRKSSAGTFLFVTLSSPDASRNALFLSNLANLQVRDELSRLAGMADVTLFGEREYSLRVGLDPEKLAARSLTAADVSKALLEFDPQKRPIRADKGFQVPLKVLGRLNTPEQVAEIVLKTNAQGGIVRLKDVARVELESASPNGDASLDGKPVVALGLGAFSRVGERKLRNAVQEKMEELKKRFPAGIDYSLAFDRTSDVKDRPTLLLAEPILPSGASAKRTREVLDRYSAILSKTNGVQHVLALPANPFGRFPGGPCLVALLAPDTERERLSRDIRRQLEKVAEAAPRMRDLSGTDGPRPTGFPVDLAIRGLETKSVVEFADKLKERLQHSGKLTDLSAESAQVPMLFVEIDKTKARALGVAPTDIHNVLQLYLGSAALGEASEFGRTWKVQVQIEGRGTDRIADLAQLQVRNDMGQMVRLSTLATLRESAGLTNLDRLDGQAAVFISANPAPGVSLAEARWLCEKRAEEVRKELRLPAEYRLVWMREMPTARPLPEDPKAPAEPTPEVAVSQPVARAVTDYADFTGRCEAVNAVSLRARVTGYVTKVLFKEGADVKKGEMLLEIDPRPYQAQLDQALSQVVLHEASLKLAQTIYDRDLTLAKTVKDAISQQQVDQDRAAVDEAKARLAAARASVEIYKLNLDFTTVRSPIDGRIGRCFATAGNLVSQDKTLLAIVVSIDPVYIYFDVDERTLMKMKALGDKELPVFVGIGTDKDYPREGKVNFVNNQVNPNTGAVSVRAVLPNRDRTLLPGMFARVRLPLGAPRKALLVPDEAIRSDQGRSYVYLVDAQNQLISRPVIVGAAHEGMRVIEKGLQPDDRVVIRGAQRVRAGMTVKPVKADLEPKEPNP